MLINLLLIFIGKKNKVTQFVHRTNNPEGFLWPDTQTHLQLVSGTTPVHRKTDEEVIELKLDLKTSFLLCQKVFISAIYYLTLKFKCLITRV